MLYASSFGDVVWIDGLVEVLVLSVDNIGLPSMRPTIVSFRVSQKGPSIIFSRSRGFQFILGSCRYGYRLLLFWLRGFVSSPWIGCIMILLMLLGVWLANPLLQS